MSLDSKKYLQVINDVKEVILDMILKLYHNSKVNIEIELIPVDKEITLMKMNSLDEFKRYDIYIEYQLSFSLYLVASLDNNGNIKINIK